MNIFKVLAQGDGNINEPNVSAFLGYLLNPGEDHGLDSLFLEEFLNQHYFFCKEINDKNSNELLSNKKDKSKVDSLNWLKDDFRTGSKYEVKVFFEQAFKNKVPSNNSNIKKEVVDIILVIYDIGDDSKVEKKFLNYISNKRTLKHIFLIEVKINDSACKNGKGNYEGQLENQIKKSMDLIKEIHQITDVNFEIKDTMSAVFVTSGQKYDNAKKAFVQSFNDPKIKDIQKSHIFWNYPVNMRLDFDFKLENQDLNQDYIFENSDLDIINDSNLLKNKSIENILDEILYPQKNEKQQPIPQYTLDTIKSFSNYLYSEFSYKIKPPKKYGQKAFTSIKELSEKVPGLTSTNIFKLLEEGVDLIKEKLNGKINNIDSYGKTHIITLEINKVKFADISKIGKIVFRFLIKRHLPNKQEIKKKIEKIIKPYGIEKSEIHEDKNSIFFEISDRLKPSDLLAITNQYLNLAKDIMTKQPDNFNN